MNATMIATLVYGCEAWNLSKQQESRVHSTQMRVLRRIKGVSRVDRVRNVDLRLRLGQEGILDVVRRRQEKWNNRLEEMNDDRTTNKVFKGELEGKRPSGRPQKR